MKKSKFNLSYLNSTTGNAGYLIPFLLQPTLPNDTFRISLTSFIRAQPMLAPLMHEVKIFTQYWFVPYRLVWDDWEDFITGGGDLTFAPEVPSLPAGTQFKTGDLGDYFGYPIGVDCGGISILPFRAYSEIWNTRYRDEDLQNDLSISYRSGSDNLTSLSLQSPSWKRDYFTTARPFTQRGNDVVVPIYTSDNTQPVFHAHTFTVKFIMGLKDYPNDASIFIQARNNESGGSSWTEADLKGAACDTLSQQNWNRVASAYRNDANFKTNVKNAVASLTQKIPLGLTQMDAAISGTFSYSEGSMTYTVQMKNFPLRMFYTFDNDETVQKPGISTPIELDSVLVYDNDGSANPGNWAMRLYDSRLSPNPSQGYTFRIKIFEQLSLSGQVTVRDLRAASALQRYGERSLQWGNRYEEFIAREFGIKPRDSRIQRPEYLGGGKGTLQISEVLQTAEGADTGVGTMRGHGVAGIGQRPIKFRCPEHGLIIGLLSIRPVPVYTQGINREFLKRSRLDFFTPELANIGMQEVLQRELYVSADNADVIFGYSDRYQEYRYNMPKVTGEFRNTLDFWNMARQFEKAPVLNQTFINMSSSESAFYRPFASQATHQFLMMLRNNIRAYRPIPKRAKNILK